MSHHLVQKAISAAIALEWHEAEKLNKMILADDSEDVDALNRLAKACGELGKIKEALTTSKKVLGLDPENKIALKALTKWKMAKDNHANNRPVVQPASATTPLFLEEPGKTKILPLINLCDKRLLSLLDSGIGVDISANGRRITISTQDGKYIGRLPDDISTHLKRLIELGNSYEAYIITVTEKEVRVFMRETKKGARAKDITSFPAEKISYVPYARSSHRSSYPESP